MSKNGKSYHLGHLIYDNFSKKPDFIVQIDAATGQSETARSVLHRSATVARCFRALGLKPGDVLALGGRNQLDLRIPFFAAIFNGLPVAAMDPLFKYGEIKYFLNIARPKIAFIQQETYDDMSKVARSLGLDTKIFTFDDGEHSMKKFIEQYGDGKSTENFKPADFDGDQVPVFLSSTSGTSGLPKLAIIHHGIPVRGTQKFVKTYSALSADPPAHGAMHLNLSPVQWISACFYSFLMPMAGITFVQSSAPASPELYVDMINKYKPITAMITPTTATAILRSEKSCDLSCFRYLMLTGCKNYIDLMQELRSRVGGQVVEGYGLTETIGMALRFAPEGPPGNCGQHDPTMNEIRLVNPETLEVITKPHTPGELYIKGVLFSGYYNMPEETKKAFSEDGFFITGDIMYRDENHYYFFVEKSKMIMRYNGYFICPTELEALILAVPGVSAAAVAAAPDRRHGELPVACVVRKPGCDVTAQQIEDVVAENVSEMKRLHGGVVFVDALPYTSTGKVARAQLREIVRKAREGL